MEGVIRTRVGYAGGEHVNPTYRSIGDHTESIQIDYDPSKISFEQLVEQFFTGHDPFRAGWSRQYASILFYHDEEQRRIAKESIARLEAKTGREVKSKLVKLGRFYRAEDYHQKYRLRGASDIMRDFMEMYPEGRDFADSTAAARINGWLAGFGDLDTVPKRLKELGLSQKGARALLEVVSRRAGGEEWLIKCL